jgi:cysteine desulfurase
VSAVKDLGVKTIITSKIEHKAVLNVVKLLEKTSSVNVVYVKLSENGIIDYNDLEKILNYDDTKKLISLMHVNNEIGTLLDLKKVSNLCEKYDAFFHSDTVQTIGKYKIDLSEINIDFIVGSAHKFHGPKGIGFTYVNKKNKLMPLVVGGSQERGMRAGTEAVHNISGMEKAFLLSYLNLQNNKKYVIELKTYFINQIKEKLPNIKFNGNCDSNDSSTYTILNLCLPVPKEKSVLLEFNLDLKGIACSRGSACQSGSSQGSHVLNNILSKDDLNKPSIRFSFSQFNKKEEIDIVVEVLKTFIRSN